MVDLSKKYAVVLDKKGEFIKLKNNGKYVVGNEIEVDLKVINHDFKALSKVVSIAAGLLLVLGLGMGAYAYNTPYNYVNLDINPSLEFTVNVFEVVLDARGINRDGKELLNNNKYEHLKIDKAVGEFIEAAVDGGFLEESKENIIMITLSGKNYDNLSTIQEKLVKTANVYLEKDEVRSEVVTEKVTLAKRESAEELSISPGKLVLIEKLKEENPDIELEEFKDKPVKDILNSIKQARKDAPQKNEGKIKTKIEENGDLVKAEKNSNVLKGNSDASKKVNTDNSKKDSEPKKLPKKDVIPPNKTSKDNMKKEIGPKAIIPENPGSKDTDLKRIDSKDQELKLKEPGEKEHDRIPTDIKLRDEELNNKIIIENELKENESNNSGLKEDEPIEDKSNNKELKDNEQENIEPQHRIPNDKTSKDASNEGLSIKDSKEIENEKYDEDLKKDFNLENKNITDSNSDQNGKDKKPFN